MNKQSFTSLLANRHLSLFLFMLFLSPRRAFAQVEQSFFSALTHFSALYADKAGFVTNVYPFAIAVNALSFLLIIIGIIFVFLIVYGGYIWLLARGNEEQITKAKGMITDAIIGVFIVLASYMITYYLIKLAFTAIHTSADSSPSDMWRL